MGRRRALIELPFPNLDKVFVNNFMGQDLKQFEKVFSFQ